MKIRNMLLCGLLAASCVLYAGCSKAENSSDNSETNDVSASVSDTAGEDATASTVGNIGDVELKAGDLIAEFEIEGYGTIKAKLFPDIAPTGVDNFVKLANEGFYDGLTVHRVIKGFMLQGGSLNGDGTGGEAADGGNFGVEINENMRHFYGALCYANAGGQNTCQFYIVNNNEPQDLSEIDLEMIKQNVEACKMYKTMYEEDTPGYLYYDNMEKYYGNLAEMIENATDEVKAKYKEVGGTPSLDGGYTVFGQVYEGFNVIDGISNAPVELNDGGELSKPLSTITITSVKITEYAD